jgi:hypothetical protein
MKPPNLFRSLWTYSRFLSKRPVKDTYGAIETPDNCRKDLRQRQARAFRPNSEFADQVVNHA